MNVFYYCSQRGHMNVLQHTQYTNENDADSNELDHAGDDSSLFFFASEFCVKGSISYEFSIHLRGCYTITKFVKWPQKGPTTHHTHSQKHERNLQSSW